MAEPGVDRQKASETPGFLELVRASIAPGEGSFDASIVVAEDLPETPPEDVAIFYGFAMRFGDRSEVSLMAHLGPEGWVPYVEEDGVQSEFPGRLTVTKRTITFETPRSVVHDAPEFSWFASSLGLRATLTNPTPQRHGFDRIPNRGLATSGRGS